MNKKIIKLKEEKNKEELKKNKFKFFSSEFIFKTQNFILYNGVLFFEDKIIFSKNNFNFITLNLVVKVENLLIFKNLISDCHINQSEINKNIIFINKYNGNWFVRINKNLLDLEYQPFLFQN